RGLALRSGGRVAQEISLLKNPYRSSSVGSEAPTLAKAVDSASQQGNSESLQRTTGRQPPKRQKESINQGNRLSFFKRLAEGVYTEGDKKLLNVDMGLSFSSHLQMRLPWNTK